MDPWSHVRPGNQFSVIEASEELAGVLEIDNCPKRSGGYADIYHGFWTNPRGERVEVAVKELRALIPRNQQTREDDLVRKAEMRIAREAFVWSRIQHLNLHPLLGYRSQPKSRLISPWCQHGNLLDYLQANPGLSRLDKLKLIYQAAYGLEHLHSLVPPISHADVKPENVLVNNLREAALSDFGLSRVLHGLGIPTGFTTSETVKGTFNYKARELFLGGEPSCHSDVYAFGGLVLTVMSGKPPFFDLHELNALFRIMSNQPPRPVDHPGLPNSDPLWNLMLRCWNQDPTARPTMRKVLWELWECISLEASDMQSRTGTLSVANSGSREDPVMDLDASDGTSQEGSSTQSTASLVPTHSTPISNIIGGKESLAPIARGVLPPAGDTFKRLQVNSKAVPVFGRYIGAAVEVGLMLIEIVKTIDRNQGMSNALESNTWKLAVFLDRLQQSFNGQREDDITCCIADIKQELQFVQRHFREMYSSGIFPKALSCCDNKDGRKRWEGVVLTVWEVMQLFVNLNTAPLVAELKDTHLQEDQRRLLNCLGDGKYGAQGNAIEDVVCLPGTRVEILERIDNWIRDTSTGNRVFWIRGMAGRGKSTIASTVAHNWQFRASCALFHFRRGQDALNRRVVCALARQLASGLVSEVKCAVLESVRQNQDIADQRLSIQFETLFVAPLSTVGHQPPTVLIVVDALDECENSKDAEDFVKLIDRHASSFPTNVKFLLTCRPETALLRVLEPRMPDVEDLDSSPDVVNDLARFFKQAFRHIREDHGLPQDWPSRRDLGRLVKMSQGLFQWARTAITYIGSRSPANRLHDLLKRPSMWSGLDDLYHQIFSRAFDNIRLDPSRGELLCGILGILVVAPLPVSLEAIIALSWDANIGMFGDVGHGEIARWLREDILADLHSLLLIPTSSSEPLCLMHDSIRDLLVSDQRCRGRAYYIDIIQHHGRLAEMCLGIMLRRLKENMCNLSDLSKGNSEIQAVVDQEVSSAIRYCCRAWSIHLTEGIQGPKLKTVGPSGLRFDFERFSREKVLCWLEVMSLIGATTEAIITAKRVHQWLLECPTALFKSSSLNNLWSDIQRFIAAFSEPISFGSLHIYLSALAHCPQKTTLWEWYGKHAKIRTIRGVQPSTWPRNLWTRSTGAPVVAVAFSPNSATLASGSDDGTIQLWDAQTGTPLGEPFTGHDDCVWSIAFSPNGKVLASGSGDTIQLWDARTGTLLRDPLQGHEGWVCSVAFSPDGKVLASGSDDDTIRLWDVQTGTPLGEPLAGHDDCVWSIVFSPDGRVLASGSEKAIRLWEVRTGAPLGKPLHGHHDSVCSVAFSPDGKVLASGSNDNTIRLWDVQTGTPMGVPLKGHDDCVWSIAFSPDGKVLASGSDDDTIRLWDARTGMSLGDSLQGHHDSVCSVVFSPDGRALASGSDDNTIRLWDVQTGAPLGELLPGHDDCVWSIAFSPDGKVLASGSDDTIQLWDALTGIPLGEPLGGYASPVRSVAFSPDGKVLEVKSDHGPIQMWNADARVSLVDQEGGASGVVSVVPLLRPGLGAPCTLPSGLVEFRDHWLISSSSRLLWLPSQYWADDSPVILLSHPSLAILSNRHLSIFNISGV